jgi:hypothetical protein
MWDSARGEVSDDSQEEAKEHSEDEPEDNKEEEEEKNEEEAEEKDEEQARAAESDADDGLKGQQAEPKFSGPLPLAKRFFGSEAAFSRKKPKRKLTKTAMDPAHKSPKKPKSRKERAAEAVKDLVDVSSSSMSNVDSLLADRSSRGRLRKVSVQRPDEYGPEYFLNFRWTYPWPSRSPDIF